MMKTKILFLLFISALTYSQQQVLRTGRLEFSDSTRTVKIKYLQNGRVISRVNNTKTKPGFSIELMDSLGYNSSSNIQLKVLSNGGTKTLSTIGAGGDGEGFISGRRQADSNATFNRFFAAWNDSVLGFVNGVEVRRDDATGSIFRKNLSLYDPTTLSQAPLFIFKRNQTGYTDSIAMSISGGPNETPNFRFSNPIVLPQISSLSMNNQSLASNGDTLLWGRNNSMGRLYLLGASANEVLQWNGSAWTHGTVSGGGGGGGLTGFRFKLQDGSFDHYRDTTLSADSNFNASTGLPFEIKFGLKQGLTNLSVPTFKALNLTTTLTSGAITSSGLFTTTGTGSNLIIGGTGASSIGAGTSQGQLGIGVTPAANVIFHTQNGMSQSEWRQENYGGFPSISLRRGDNTPGSPTAVASGEILGDYQWKAYDGTSFSSNPNARLLAGATENFSNSAHGTELKFYTTPNTTTSPVLGLTIGQDGALTSIGAISGRAYTLQNPTYTGSTTLTQAANNQMTVTNTAGIMFDFPLFAFVKSPFLSTISSAGLTTNRSITFPNASGTIAVSATSPLVLSSTGDISLTGGFVQSLNGLTAATQTFSVGSTGTTPNIASAVADHRFNFPLASATVTSGMISNGDQIIAGKKTLSGTTTLTAHNFGFLKTSNTVVTVAEQAEYFECDPSVNGNMSMNLSNVSAATMANRIYTFSRWTNGTGTNTVSITPFGTEKIEGMSTIVLTKDYDFITITNDGTSALGWKVLAGVVDGSSYMPNDSLKIVAAVAYILASSDSVFFSIPGFDSTKGWVGGATYTDGRTSQVPLPTPQLIKRPNGISVKANYDWLIDNVEISFMYKLKK